MKKSEKDKKKTRKSKKSDSKNIKKKLEIKKQEKEVKIEKLEKKEKKIKITEKEKPSEKEESELEEDLEVQEFEEMPVPVSSRVITAARRIVSQPVPKEPEALETRMRNIPSAKPEEKTELGKYQEFEKTYDTRNLTPYEDKRKDQDYDRRDLNIETSRERETETQKREVNLVELRKDYSVQEEKDKEKRDYETRHIKVKRV